MNHEALKQRHRQVRDAHPQNLALRVHRALSWLKRAEMCEDLDGRFIFLWIAFNSAYAQEILADDRLSEQTTFKSFIEKLCNLDRGGRIEALVWNSFSGSIRTLLDNPYVFESFWEHQRGRLNEDEWKERFASGKRSAQLALASRNTAKVLGVTFNRIYTLRNQLMHGGATWDSAVNRDQVRDCANLLGKFVPLVIEVMMDNPDTVWGDACYPVVATGP